MHHNHDSTFLRAVSVDIGLRALGQRLAADTFEQVQQVPKCVVDASVADPPGTHLKPFVLKLRSRGNNSREYTVGVSDAEKHPTQKKP